MKNLLYLLGIVTLVGGAMWAEGEPERPARFDLVYPNYRGLIFPSGGDIEVEVLFENRNNGKRLTDAFKPLEVHVYDLGPTRK